MSNIWGSHAPFPPYTQLLPHAPYQQALQPGACTPVFKPTPLPPPSFGSTQLNPHLAYTNTPHIEYDVRHHPASALAHNAELMWLDESATSPSINEMIIVCMVLPMPFVVRPLTRGLRNFVTINDILVATHDAFFDAYQSDVAANGFVTDLSRQLDATWPGHGTPLLMTSHHQRATLTGRYRWAGLSEQYETGRWLLHVE